MRFEGGVWNPLPNSVPQGRLNFRPVQICFERCLGSATALSLERPSPFVIPSEAGFPAALLSSAIPDAVLFKENHTQPTEAATLDRKSGEAERLSELSSDRRCPSRGCSRGFCTPLSPRTGAPCLRRRSRGTTWVEQDGAKPFPLLSFPCSEIKEREDPPTAGFQAPDKAVIPSEALRSSIANRSRRACARAKGSAVSLHQRPILIQSNNP
jgi:hypothetical protein